MEINHVTRNMIPKTRPAVRSRLEMRKLRTTSGARQTTLKAMRMAPEARSATLRNAQTDLSDLDGISYGKGMKA